MKKLIPITLIITTLFLSACGLKDIVGPNAGGTSNSDSYQPVMKGSTWQYTIQAEGTLNPFNETITMTGDLMTVKGAVFYKASAVTPDGASDGYFGRRGSLYISFSADDGMEEPYLDDSKEAGMTYTVATTDPSAPNIPARYVGTILEKNISKTVNSKTFNNVYHTRVELQYDNSTGYITSVTDEYYIAKGVGIIETDVYFPNPLTGKQALVAKQTITNYNIK